MSRPLTPNLPANLEFVQCTTIGLCSSYLHVLSLVQNQQEFEDVATVDYGVDSDIETVCKEEAVT